MLSRKKTHKKTKEKGQLIDCGAIAICGRFYELCILGGGRVGVQQ
jgi:hypothetical protein